MIGHERYEAYIIGIDHCYGFGFKWLLLLLLCPDTRQGTARPAAAGSAMVFICNGNADRDAHNNRSPDAGGDCYDHGIAHSEAYGRSIGHGAILLPDHAARPGLLKNIIRISFYKFLPFRHLYPSRFPCTSSLFSHNSLPEEYKGRWPRIPALSPSIK